MDQVIYSTCSICGVEPGGDHLIDEHDLHELELLAQQGEREAEQAALRE